MRIDPNRNYQMIVEYYTGSKHVRVIRGKKLAEAMARNKGKKTVKDVTARPL